MYVTVLCTLVRVTREAKRYFANEGHISPKHARPVILVGLGPTDVCSALVQHTSISHLVDRSLRRAINRMHAEMRPLLVFSHNILPYGTGKSVCAYGGHRHSESIANYISLIFTCTSMCMICVHLNYMYSFLWVIYPEERTFHHVTNSVKLTPVTNTMLVYNA